MLDILRRNNIRGVGSVVARGDLIRKIAIPRYLTVVSSSVSALINFSLNIMVLFVIMAVTGTEVNGKLLLFVPLLIIQLYVFSLSLAFILSAAFVKFRDVSFIWEVFTQMLFYLTPIIYPLSFVLDKYSEGKLLLYNPLAQIIQDLRYILVTPQTQTAWSINSWRAGFSVLLTVFVLLFAAWYFKRESVEFAENI